MDKKLNRISLMLILLGIIFIGVGCIGNIYQVNKYKTQTNKNTKENTFTIHIQNQRKANVKVLGYKPNSNTKETILEAYGVVKLKQNNNGLEIIVDTESGE